MTAVSPFQALPVAPSLLGESPFWHPDEAALYWCDIPGKALNRWHPGTAAHRVWPFDTEPGCAAPLPGGHPLRRRYPVLYPEPVLPEAAVPGITAVLERFHAALADLQRRFLRVIALGMGCAETFFEEMVHEAPTLTRAIRYPPMAAAPAAGHLWAAPHADINLITALPRATAAGLEVEVNGRWQAAAPPEGRVILNTGLMLERLSNGTIPAGWHRVVAPPGASGERHSVVQFCHARPSTILAPVPSCCSAAHPQRWAGVRAAEALEEVLYRINLMAP